MRTRDLKQLFWDIDEVAIPSLPGKVIISRTLSRGTSVQIQELFSSYGKDAVRAVFADMKPTALSARRRDYFTLILS